MSSEDPTTKIILQNIHSDLKDIKEEMAEIKHKIYEPDNGLYARLQKLQSSHEMSSTWFNILGKIGWVIFGGMISLALKLIFGT